MENFFAPPKRFSPAAVFYFFFQFSVAFWGLDDCFLVIIRRPIIK